MKKLAFISIILTFITAGCLDPFTFESNAEEAGALVINGQLNDSGEKQIVTLGLTQTFGLKVFEGVTGAKVEICESESNQCGILTEESLGVYTSTLPELTITTGKSYYINITLSDGSSYTSTPQTMPEKVVAERAFHEFREETDISEFGNETQRDVIDIFIDTKFGSSGNAPYLRWSFDELYLFDEITCGPLHQPKTCYVPLLDESQAVVLLNTNQIEGDELKNLLIHTRRSFPLTQYRNRHYFNVSQFSLSEEAFQYWSIVKSVTEQAGTVFDPPPASIPGNIYNVNDEKDRLLGFFEVASQDIKRTFVLPGDFQRNINAIRTCSQFRGTFGAECCECLELENAIVTRPDWVK